MIKINIELLQYIQLYFGDRNINTSFVYDIEYAMRLANTNEISINKKTIEDICKWCEIQAVYDKLGRYNNFYYKLKNKLNSNN